jgi:hypothetical protein
MKDPIVEEIRNIRDAHAAKFQFDLHAICKDLRKQEQTCGHPVVSFPPKRTLKKPFE